MKTLILIASFLISASVFAGASTAGCYSTASRSNVLGVLTASKYNSELNIAYNELNALDGGCLQNGTLEADAMNVTDFGAHISTGISGCVVSLRDADNVQISACRASVNGKQVTTSGTNDGHVPVGEAPSTVYYVYIQNGSEGSTLNAVLSATAPNADGYDASSNRVLASVYNDASSNLIDGSVRMFGKAGFTYNLDGDSTVKTGTCALTIDGGTTPTVTTRSCKAYSSVTDTGVGQRTVNWAAGYWASVPVCVCSVHTESRMCTTVSGSETSVLISITDDTGTNRDNATNVLCIGVTNF